MYQEFVLILSNQEVMPGVHLMRIESPNLSAASIPGQFVMIRCDNGYGRILRRPISIFQKHNNFLDFLFSLAGAGTAWLSQRRKGEKIDVLGPLGNGFTIQSESKNLLLIAGGMGVAPLNFLAWEALKKGLKVKITNSAITGDQLCPEQYLPDKRNVITSTDDGSAGEPPARATDFIPQYLSWADQIYICGPLAMYKTVVANYLPLFKRKQVQVSLELRMGCGMGLCYGCSVMTKKGLKQVCKDGPVFDIKDVIWERLS
jgi:dihydroorotate dehydrogenase electron transfer subunit